MENEEQLRRQRHDLRHQLTVIQALADDQNRALHDYIHTLLETVPTAASPYCENLAVNAVVSYYAGRCTEQRIEFDAQLDVPADTRQTTANELCVIFGNLLENGTEACGRMNEGRRFIRLKSNLPYDMLTITMDNSFDGKVKQENGKFYFQKREDFGIGLSSIQAVARKRQGDARFEADELVFRSSVYLRV